MDKADIQKLGCCSTGDENWKVLQEILTVLWDKAFPGIPGTGISDKKGKK